MQPTSKPATGASAAPIDLLIERRGRFLSFLKRSEGHDPDVEDVLQDAFVKTLEHQGRLRDSQRAVAWFYRVLRNELVDRHRRGARHLRAIEALRWQSDDAHPAEAQAPPAPSMQLLLQGLPPRHRETLEVLYSAEGNLNALATRAGITLNHAAVRACRARKALRDLRANEASAPAA